MQVEPKQNPRTATEHFLQGARQIFQADAASPELRMSPEPPRLTPAEPLPHARCGAGHFDSMHSGP